MSSLRVSTAVAIGGRALLLEGPPGIGKSSLALALIDRGAVLIGDDGISLEAVGRTVEARPAPATRGLIELRNIGIVTVPTATAKVSLLLNLDPAAPRSIDGPGSIEIAGCAVPCLAFDPRGPAAAVRAEYALALHGLALPTVA